MSAELFNIHCVLFLEILYSTTMDLIGSLNFTHLLYRATDDIPGGSPSHDLMHLLTFFSNTSTVDMPIS